MKIAILSDIHGNYPALEAVTDHVERWQPDLVFVAGDIVNRGPRSHDCLQFLLEKQKSQGWEIIRGNHEDYIISRDDPHDPKTGPQYELFQPTHYIYQQLNRDVSSLVALPEEITKRIGQAGTVRMVHASMRHNRDGIYPETSDARLQRQIAPAPEVFITGHTHRPFVRYLGKTLVVNAGSVGLPFDQDRRAGYAQVTRQGGHWKGEIIRLPYDIAQAERDFYETGYLEGAGPLARIVLLEMESALSQLWHWAARFTKPVLEREITVAESTERFLQDPVREPYW
jgi:putative phosphoesterase